MFSEEELDTITDLLTDIPEVHDLDGPLKVAIRQRPQPLAPIGKYQTLCSTNLGRRGSPATFRLRYLLLIMIQPIHPHSLDQILQ